MDYLNRLKERLEKLRLERSKVVRLYEDGRIDDQIEALEFRISRIETGACPACLGPKHSGDCPTI